MDPAEKQSYLLRKMINRKYNKPTRVPYFSSVVMQNNIGLESAGQIKLKLLSFFLVLVSLFLSFVCSCSCCVDLKTVCLSTNRSTCFSFHFAASPSDSAALEQNAAVHFWSDCLPTVQTLRLLKKSPPSQTAGRQTDSRQTDRQTDCLRRHTQVFARTSLLPDPCSCEPDTLDQATR